MTMGGAGGQKPPVIKYGETARTSGATPKPGAGGGDLMGALRAGGTPPTQNPAAGAQQGGDISQVQWQLDQLQSGQGKIEKLLVLLSQKLDQPVRATNTVGAESYTKVLKDLELRDRQLSEFQNKEAKWQEKLHDAEYKERQANQNADKAETEYLQAVEERDQLAKRLLELQAENRKLAVELNGRPALSLPLDAYRQAVLQWAAKRRAPFAASPEVERAGARVKGLHLKALTVLGAVKGPSTAHEAVANLKRALDEARGLFQEVEGAAALPQIEPTLSFQVVTGPVPGLPESVPHFAVQVEAPYGELLTWAESWGAGRGERAEALLGKLPYIQDLLLEAYRECFAAGLTAPGHPAEAALRDLLEVQGLRAVVPQPNKRFDVHDHEPDRDDYDSPLAPGYITAVIAPGFLATDGSYIRKPRVAVSARR